MSQCNGVRRRPAFNLRSELAIVLAHAADTASLACRHSRLRFPRRLPCGLSAPAAWLARIQSRIEMIEGYPHAAWSRFTHCQRALDQPQHRVDEASAVVVEVRLVRRAPDRAKMSMVRYGRASLVRSIRRNVPRAQKVHVRRAQRTSPVPCRQPPRNRPTSPTSSPNPTAHYEKATTGKSA